MGIAFEWNPAKAAENQRKHGISFEEASTAFLDDHALIILDPDHSGPGEERFVLMGFSDSARLLIVVHCLRRSGRVIRLISARRATKREAKQYAAGRKR